MRIFTTRFLTLFLGIVLISLRQSWIYIIGGAVLIFLYVKFQDEVTEWVEVQDEVTEWIENENRR